MTSTLTTIIPVGTANLPTISNLTERAQQFAQNSTAENTRTAYQSDWRAWQAFCARHGHNAMPATAQGAFEYAADMAERGLRVATIERRISSLRMAHRTAGHPDPTLDERVRRTMAGIRRELGTAPNQKAPALASDIREMAGAVDDSITGLRDRALILIGFAGAFRRSEVGRLDASEVQFVREGVVIRLWRSKADQEGERKPVAIPFGGSPETCPVRALRQWMDAADIEDGPVFRRIWKSGRLGDKALSGQAVADIVKRLAERVGLDPQNYAGHSLRSGFATQAAKSKVGERKLMDHGRWSSVQMARRYIREAELFEENAAGALGL